MAVAAATLFRCEDTMAVAAGERRLGDVWDLRQRSAGRTVINKQQQQAAQKGNGMGTAVMLLAS